MKPETAKWLNARVKDSDKRRSKHPDNQVRDEKIRTLWERGQPVQEVAERFDLSPGRVGAIANEAIARGLAMLTVNVYKVDDDTGEWTRVG